MSVSAIVPVRSFMGLSRLSGTLDDIERESLMRWMVEHTVTIIHEAGLRSLIVTNDPEVTSWGAEHAHEVVPEPESGGLSAAAAAGVASAAGPWMIVHADLPALDAGDLRTAADLVEHGDVVLAPSHDGGTSLIGSTGGTFPFRYGPGSFRRHLAAINGDAAILFRPGLALDLDRPWDLWALRRLGYLDVRRP